MIALLGLLIASLLVFGGTSGQTGDGASLRFKALHPVRLAGTGFKPGESVRVRVQAGQKLARRRVTATDNGAFTVKTSLSFDPCLGAFATAIGNEGSRAKATTGMRACPPSERSNASPSGAPQP